MLAGGKREKGEGRIHSPLYFCMRALDWNSLCWLVESERGKGKEESCPLVESEGRFQDLPGIPLIPWKSGLQVL
jgi:hypothetical protein